MLIKSLLVCLRVSRFKSEAWVECWLILPITPLEPPQKETIKMATSTDMKGNVVKMEVDYSDTVDKRIPECEALASVS